MRGPIREAEEISVPELLIEQRRGARQRLPRRIRHSHEGGLTRLQWVWLIGAIILLGAGCTLMFELHRLTNGDAVANMVQAEYGELLGQ